MKKQIRMKLMAMSLLLLTSIIVVVSASYAWLTMSENPEVNGLQISLSAGNTILIAPDLTTVVDGTVYHYPGSFSDTLDFSQHSSYNYLQSLGGLTPVSTADGIHWFYATYFGENDPEVLAGLASAGDLRPLNDFALDNSLLYANQPAGAENLSTGHYVYLDFWVVAPGANYTLRISSGKDGGSYAIDLLDPTLSSETVTGYTLENLGVTSTAASVRIGFLASSAHVGDDSYLHYYNSAAYDSRYTSLRGIYAEPGQILTDTDHFQFMIYEPNADAHPSGRAPEGSFVATYPLGMVGGYPIPADVRGITAVQLTNWWSAAENGSDLLIEQFFQASLMGKTDKDTAAAEFYTKYLQGHLLPYIDRGDFIRYSYTLDDTISAEWLQTLEKDSATEDVFIIALERNVPQRIRMYIWLEGQDVDWDPSSAGNRFALSVELAGGSH